MTEVKRYSQTFLRLNIMNGLFVSAYDYDALRAENERLREELTCLNDEIIDHRNYTKACRERAELQALKGGAVPSGYALVPSEPTGVMKDCGSSVLALIGNGTWTAADCYRAMLSAAPQPAEKAQEVQQAERQEPVAWARQEELEDPHDCLFVSRYEYAKTGYSVPLYTAPQPAQDVSGLLEWVVERWHAEVSQRPLHNVHRRSLDDTWRQVIRRLGGDPVDLCGPNHDSLFAAHRAKEGG